MLSFIITCLLVTQPQNTTSPNEVNHWVAQINEERRRCGANPVRLDPRLQAAAQWKANHLAALNYLDHQDRNVFIVSNGERRERLPDERAVFFGFPGEASDGISVGGSTPSGLDYELGRPYKINHISHHNDLVDPGWTAVGTARCGNYTCTMYGRLDRMEAPPAERRASQENRTFGQTPTAPQPYQYKLPHEGTGVKENTKYNQTKPPAIPEIALNNQKSKLLGIMNSERVRKNMSPLCRNSILTNTAHEQARYLASIDSLKHTGPNNSTVYDRVRAANYTGELTSSAELLARLGNTIPIEGWIASPGYELAMLEPQATEVGIGAVQKDSRVYWVVIFGQSE